MVRTSLTWLEDAALHANVRLQSLTVPRFWPRLVLALSSSWMNSVEEPRLTTECVPLALLSSLTPC